MPPITNVIMNPMVQRTGDSRRTRPRYIVNSQLKIFTPVGTAITIVVMPKKALTSAPDPIVKKWCSHTRNERSAIAMVANTMEV